MSYGIDWAGIDRCVGVRFGWAPHPGEVLSDWLHDHDMSRTDLARLIRVNPGTVSRLILNRDGRGGQFGCSNSMALRLEKGTGIRAEVWLHLQMAHDLARLRGDT